MIANIKGDTLPTLITDTVGLVPIYKDRLELSRSTVNYSYGTDNKLLSCHLLVRTQLSG